MEKIQTITVNGSTYTIEDPAAARIVDSRVGDNAWSSRQILDRLCPAFSESGAAVTCRPVEGYPLRVVSRIEPVQAGSGDPAPDNLRPISGRDTVALTLSNEDARVTRTADLGQTVYGGSLDWSTGVLTIEKAFAVFDGSKDEGWSTVTTENGVKLFSIPLANGAFSGSTTKGGVCNYLKPDVAGVYYATADAFYFYAASASYQRLRIFITGIETTVEALRGWLAKNPLQVVYPVNPITVQLSSQEVLALAGSNTLSSDTGDTQVTGRLDPLPLLQQLAGQL